MTKHAILCPSCHLPQHKYFLRVYPFVTVLPLMVFTLAVLQFLYSCSEASKAKLAAEQAQQAMAEATNAVYRAEIAASLSESSVKKSNIAAKEATTAVKKAEDAAFMAGELLANIETLREETQSNLTAQKDSLARSISRKECITISFIRNEKGEFLDVGRILFFSNALKKDSFYCTQLLSLYDWSPPPDFIRLDSPSLINQAFVDFSEILLIRWLVANPLWLVDQTEKDTFHYAAKRQFLEYVSQTGRLTQVISKDYILTSIKDNIFVSNKIEFFPDNPMSHNALLLPPYSKVEFKRINHHDQKNDMWINNLICSEYIRKLIITNRILNLSLSLENGSASSPTLPHPTLNNWSIQHIVLTISAEFHPEYVLTKDAFEQCRWVNNILTTIKNDTDWEVVENEIKSDDTLKYTLVPYILKLPNVEASGVSP